MPRMDGIDVSTFPVGSDEVELNTNIVNKLEILSESISDVVNVQEESLTQLGLIRQASEIAIDEDLVEEMTDE